MIKFSAVLPVSILFIFSTLSHASLPIKKSSSGICHDESSGSYERTQKYTAFDSIPHCVESGGRLPKNMKASSSQSANKYSRSQFGSGWSDSDKDCQNSRMEALISQSLAPVHFKTGKECMVKSGRWNSPYSGKTIYKASDIDIDHVVPLKWAWDHGANQWPKEKRVQIANDPANLLSVEASLNRQKGAKGLDEWLPPKNQCQYIARFERIRITYGLDVSASKEKAFNKMKDRYCG
ncbi:HNH endonuclease family protein [Aliivibrio kagoshimensis]|uniref:HNH endonuclease family protein n=1 Tax=Aliivibrio kagoshimensis TaxID=2910230 RepID=UPI003D117B85